MKLETTFLRSRVARRIFVLFICCALVPIGALAILSFSQVEKQLNELGQKRLHNANKAVGMAILERLIFLGDGMKLVASKYRTDSSPILPPPAAEFGEHLKERFKGLAIITGKGERIPLFGHTQNIPKLTPEQKQRILSGRLVVSSECYPDLTHGIFMTMALDAKNHGQGVLLGQLDPAYLWVTSAENPLLPMTELCILDQSNHVLFSTLPGPVFPEQVMLQMSRSALGQFEWVHEKKEYMRISVLLSSRRYFCAEMDSGAERIEIRSTCTCGQFQEDFSSRFPPVCVGGIIPQHCTDPEEFDPSRKASRRNEADCRTRFQHPGDDQER
jgi:hypothetical protein